MKSGSFSSYRAALSGTGADIGGERDDEPEPDPGFTCGTCGGITDAPGVIVCPNCETGDVDDNS